MSTEPMRNPPDQRDPDASFTFLNLDRPTEDRLDEITPSVMNLDKPREQVQDLRTEIQRLFTPGKKADPKLKVPTLPGYEILGELGRGGMGVVYKARQTVLNRIVALKMILAGTQADREDLQRFINEAAAVARLKHPNIVQIYEIGHKDNLPYFSLEYVDGGSLTQRTRGIPLSPGKAAALLQTLAEAMHEAHQHGIVHRDLKPGNILMTKDGQPKITDFGLAKFVSGDSNKHKTRTNEVLGTPSYMSPEQAEGRPSAIAPATDIYSLGAILYDLLTGRPPFLGDAPMITLLQVLERDPVPPTQLQPKIPRDLETICLKCLAKEPKKRYASGKSLAADLKRFLDGEPIMARPAGLPTRLWKWAKRRPVVAALSAGLVLMTLFALLGVSWGWTRAVRAQSAAEAARDDAESARHRESQLREQAESSLYFSRVAQAELQWRDNHVDGAERLLDFYLPDRGSVSQQRGWEWHYLKRLCHADAGGWHTQLGWVHHLAISPDGRKLAFAGGIPWNLPGRNPAEVPGEAVIVNVATGSITSRISHPGAVWGVAFSPDCAQLATTCADGKVRLWNPDDTARPQSVLPAPGAAVCAAYSPDGKFLAVGGFAFVRVWNRATNELIAAFQKHDLVSLQLAFSPDSRRLLGSEKLIIWDVQTGQTLRGLTEGGALDAALSRDGRSIAGIAADGQAAVWDAETGKTMHRLGGHVGGANAVAFSYDSRFVATAGNDRVVRVWDLTTGDPVQTYRGHAASILSVAFHPNGRQLISGDQNGAVKSWDLNRAAQEYIAIRDAGQFVNDLTFSADSKRVVAASAGLIRHWDVENGQLASKQELNIAGSGVWEFAGTAFSADKRMIAGPAADDAKLVKLWQVDTGLEVRHFVGHRLPVTTVALSAGGRYLATASWDRDQKGPTTEPPWELFVWDATTGRQIYTVQTQAPTFCLAFSPDGRYCAASGMDGVWLWDAATGKKARFLGLGQNATGVAFSPDSKTIAAVSFFGNGALWDTESAQQIGAFQGPQSLNTIVFSPDGRRLAGASRDMVKLWDAATCQELLTLRPLSTRRERDIAFLPRVVFSPDGKRIAANYYQGGQILVWDTN